MMQTSLKPVFRLLSLGAFTGLATAAPAMELKPSGKGIVINGGNLGDFEFGYPSFSDGGKEIHPLVEACAEGSKASLKYEGGGTVEVVANPVGEVTLTFSGTPADVKSFSSTTLVDISFNRGGKWKAGDQSGDFPKEKPSKPQLFSGNASALSIINAQGDKLNIQAPDYTFTQLTDNREWNWPIFALKCFVPLTPGARSAKFKFGIEKSSGEAKLVDSFGQSTLEDWPGKLKSEDELKADLAKDEAYYASFKTPQLDPYGGFPGSGEAMGLKKTGFFHIDQKDGQSRLVDPAGNLFFHTGLCGFQPSDDYTYIQGRENIYTWLPKGDATFASAFRKDDPTAFSFYVANTIRKFGRPYDHDVFAARMIDRVRKLGFNSIGAFSAVPPTAAKQANFPYVLSLPLNEWESGIKTIPDAHEVWDPFDEPTRTGIAKALAEKLPARANDPLLIGYFIVNEPRYDELPKVIPSLNADHACKREFVGFLKAKYQEITAFNTAWKASAASFDELAAKGLAVSTPEAAADTKAFTGVFLEALLQLIQTHYRQHDPNHLLMGNRLQPVTIRDEQLCRISGKYVDVVSYNYYTHEVDKAELKQIHQWSGGKPMMLSEFFWSSPRDSGLSGGRQVHSQQERGLMYRNYVEQSASLGFVIGIEWFTLIDQASTGRWFSKYNGESANTGLFSAADRPWKPMVEEMAKTNNSLYDLLLGKRSAFAWEHAKARGE